MAGGDGSTTAFQRVRELFEAAIDLPADERAGFLDRECAGAVNLRQEVEQLLSHDAAEGRLAGLLERGAEPLIGSGGIAVGGRIGAFRLCSVLGGGGMGTVYEAEQDEPRRRVALKVLSLGLVNERAVRRFRWEAEVLARLQHPAIAQVFAVGIHESGRLELPWFAMELVPNALDLVSYVRQRRLSLRDRVRLMLQVCEGVHHGHLQGVVHRDLKPQNVLVDDGGRVKVIDFGIARSMTTDADAMTEGGIVLGTLHYMSPEQLRGHSVDLRSDIFSLGVVLFELLADRRPFVFDETTPLAVAERVQSQDAPRLSTIVRGIDRDLEVVVQKALRREVDDRYASVAEFAADLRAVLDRRPVRARAPSTFYQLRMFARRRRGLVAALASIAALVVVAVVIVLAQNFELARRERVAQRVARFARDFLSESSLMQTRGVDYTVREALDVAAGALADETFEDPEIEAELRELVGETYRSLSLPDTAEPHLVRARNLWLQIDGPKSRRANEVAMSIVLAERELGHMTEAEELLDTVAAAFDGAGNEDDPLWWQLQHNRAFVMRHQGRLRDAERLFRAVIAGRERLLGRDAEPTVITMHNLGTLLLGLRRPEEARDVLADALARAEAAGHADASTWQIADNLAGAWAALGELDRAAAAHRRAMQGFEELVGPDHRLTLGCGYHLLKVLYRQGERDALEELATDLLARCERAFGVDDYRTMDVLQALAAAHTQAGDWTTAITELRRAFAAVARNRGTAHPDTFNAGHNLAMAQLGAEQAEAALATTAGLIAVIGAEPEAMQQMPPGSIGLTWLLQARALRLAGRRAEALTAARTARQSLSADLSAEHELATQAAALEAELGER
ncbi:MAG: protein kinase [Planctomycetes bacterium]|nr:protein kinase [Planctomycetota bacterium]